MKLSSVLAQFLYTQKYLHLTGIGRFVIEDPFIAEPEKSQKGNELNKIIFEQDNTTGEDKELIAFASTQTGKMQSLAAADIDSYLELVKQFLNIGKPFLFEGIGTLVKNKSGQYDFVQTQPLNKKIKEPVDEEFDQTSTTENSFTGYEEMFSPKKPKSPFRRRIAIWLVCAVGLILAVWGGYIVYNRSKSSKKNKEINNESSALPNTIKSSRDTTKIISTPSQSVDRTYRFIIEKAGKDRAIARFNYLKTLGIDVKMETKDSVLFRLFFDLPVMVSDTAKIRDSLSLLYSTRGHAYIEQ